MRHSQSFPISLPVLFAVALISPAAVRARGGASDDRDRAAPSFSRDIQPILAAHCLKCHDPVKRKGDLDLSTPAKIEAGGASGPAIERGSSSKSLLYEQVSKREMPPGKAAKLTDDQIRLIARWIDSGARGDGVSEAAAPLKAPTH